MSLARFRSENHPQQTKRRGPRPEIDDRATPPEWFAELHQRFRFTVDAAAQAHNAKLPKFWSPEDDGLVQSWRGERVFCNPPYSSIEPWVMKARKESTRAALIVMLLPANRTEQGWWQRWVEPFRDGNGSGPRVEFLADRRRFIRAGKTAVGKNERPPFGVCLLIWSEEGVAS